MQIDLRSLISIEEDEKLEFISKNEVFLSLNSATLTSMRNICRDLARDTRNQRDIIQRVFSSSSRVHIFDNESISTVIIVNEKIITRSAIEFLNMNNQIEIEHSEKSKHEKNDHETQLTRSIDTFVAKFSIFIDVFFLISRYHSDENSIDFERRQEKY